MKAKFSFKNRKAIFPGWKMTVEQHGLYFRMLEQCYAAMRVTGASEKEEARKLIHLHAFKAPISAKEIDKLAGFDKFKAACLAILDPNNLEAQLAIANMERTRLIYRINQLAPEAYWRAEAKRKFGHADLELLAVDELTMLRNHLQARAGEIVWPAPELEPVAASADPDWGV